MYSMIAARYVGQVIAGGNCRVESSTGGTHVTVGVAVGTLDEVGAVLWVWVHLISSSHTESVQIWLNIILKSTSNEHMFGES